MQSRQLPNNHEKRYLEMGSCYNGYMSYGVYKRWLSCAWEPKDCNLTVAGNSFLGTDQDEDYIKKCNPSDQPIGRCLLENKCALRATDCGTGLSAMDANFRADDPTCTIQRDKALEWDVSDPQFTQFGSCLDKTSGEYFCVYDPKNCEDSGTEVYVNAVDTLAAGVVCDCSEVHVSACITDSKRAFCAINAEGCRERWPYYSPHTQRLDRDDNSTIVNTPTPGIDCRLCRKRNTPSPTASPTTFLKPTQNPTSNPTASPMTVLPTVQSRDESRSGLTATADPAESNDKNSHTGAIIGGTIGGVVFIGIIAVVYVRMFRKAEENNKKKKKSRRRPAREINLT